MIWLSVALRAGSIMLNFSWATMSMFSMWTLHVWIQWSTWVPAHDITPWRICSQTPAQIFAHGKNVEYTSNATSKSCLAKLLGPNLAAKLLPSSYPTDVCIKIKNHHSYGIHISDMSHFLKDFRLKTGDVEVLTCFKMHSIPIHIWLMVYLPLWKIWVRQIGSSQPLGTIKVMFQTTNQI